MAREQMAEAEHRSISDNARALALLNMATSDSLVASFAAKYHYNFWRPETAIRFLGDYGNSKTPPDPAYVPFISTPCFPSYPSNHASGSNGAAEILRRVYGEGGHTITLTNPSILRSRIWRSPTRRSTRCPTTSTTQGCTAGFTSDSIKSRVTGSGAPSRHTSTSTTCKRRTVRNSCLNCHWFQNLWPPASRLRSAKVAERHAKAAAGDRATAYKLGLHGPSITVHAGSRVEPSRYAAMDQRVAEIVPDGPDREEDSVRRDCPGPHPASRR